MSETDFWFITAHPPCANFAPRKEGTLIPTTITTAGGLKITVRHLMGDERPRALGHDTDQAQLQLARLVAFLRNDDHFYFPRAAVQAAGLAPVRAGWHEVDSTSIRAVKWDPDRKSLTVEFMSNRARYRYDNMHEGRVREFLDAPSHGQYFDQNIKGRYPSTKLAE